jgi:hypothetical protein
VRRYLGSPEPAGCPWVSKWPMKTNFTSFSALPNS